MREAIRRLTAEGALSFNDNRRVCVPTLSLKDLEDVSFARQFLEPKLIFMAAQQVTAQDIAALITLDSALDQAIFRGDAPMYLRLNYQFHHQLYQLARAPIFERLNRWFMAALRAVIAHRLWAAWNASPRGST